MIRRFAVLSTLYILLNGAGSALGAAVTIIPTGGGTFAIQGSDLENVTALDITVGYNSKLLSNPTVTQGGLIAGGMMAQNLGQPGKVRLGIINPQPNGISGSGTIATISFAGKGGPGGILFVNASLVGADGKADVTSQDGSSVSGDAPASTAAAADQAGQPQQAALSGLTVATSSSPAEVSANAPTAAPAPAAPAPEEPAATAEAEEAVPPVEEGKEKEAAPAPAAELRAQEPTEKGAYVRKEGVADRFRRYTGPRTPEALAALFTGTGEDLRQEPSVCLSDGSATLSVRIRVAPSGPPPSFSLMGARVVSLKQEGEWYIVEARPEKQRWDAVLTLRRNESITEIPLTVAPPLSAAVTHDALAAWLRSNPRREGGNGWLDDYIRTANYLSSMDSAKKKAASH